MRPTRLPRRAELPWLLVLAAVGYAYPFVTMPYLVARLGSGFVGMTMCFVPLLTVLLSVPMLGALPTVRQLVGVLGGLGCMAVILVDGVQRSIAPGQLALAVSVPLCFAFANVLTRRWLGGVRPYLLTLCCALAVGIVLAPAGLAVEPMRVERSLSLPVASLVVLGSVGTALSLLVFFRLLQRRGARRDGDLSDPPGRARVGLGRCRAGDPLADGRAARRARDGGAGADRNHGPGRALKLQDLLQVMLTARASSPQGAISVICRTSSPVGARRQCGVGGRI
jgi:hypothetical protein